MQINLSKNHIRKFFSLVLSPILFVVIGGGYFSFAQAQGDVLVDGNPPLTNQMVERYCALLEWSLEVDFTATERAAVQKQLVQYWRKDETKNIKGVVDALAFEENINRASEAKRREVQPQIKQAMLETMEREKQDALNALLLGVYNRSQQANANTENDPAADGADLSQLTGKWQVLHGNSIVGIDINGRIGDGNAMIAEFDVRADGRVIYTFVLQQSNYGCTTRIKTSKTGRAAISGSRVTFSYDGGTTTSEDNCNAKYNYTKKLAAEKEIFDFNVERKDGKSNFCFANQKIKDCAVKVK